jgi:hypothetical protein
MKKDLTEDINSVSVQINNLEKEMKKLKELQKKLADEHAKQKSSKEFFDSFNTNQLADIDKIFFEIEDAFLGEDDVDKYEVRNGKPRFQRRKTGQFKNMGFFLGSRGECKWEIVKDEKYYDEAWVLILK